MRRKRQARKNSRGRRKLTTKHGLLVRRRRLISNAKLERGLTVLSQTADPKVAARAIHVSPEQFKQAAQRKGVIRKRKNRWTIAAALPRRVAIFTNGRQLAITVRSRTASLIGRYNSAVGQFLRTNKLDVLAEFKGRAAKDIRGKTYPLETDPNVLYRLSSAGGETFEEIYRIVL